MSGTEVDFPGAVWRKASKSNTNNECVEVADLGDRVAVRDSKNPGGPKLIFAPHAWRSFLIDARGSEFD